MPMKGREIIEASRGKLLQGNTERTVSGFAIDSRKVRAGDFFVPLKGEREDGHRYIADAVERGAAGSFYAGVSVLPSLPPDTLVIQVPDVLAALQQTASFYRRGFEVPVIGVTGSSGKTTTKDFIAAVMGVQMNILKTEGNLNNEIGLPLTLLSLERRHRAAVLEMGMSAPGEIAALAKMADPQVGVITSIGEAHLEMLGSIEAVARAKEELLDYIGESGTAVLNGDDHRLVEMGKRFPGKVLYYGFERAAVKGMKLSQKGEDSLFRVRFPDNQEYDFSLPFPGRHIVGNALAALAVGCLFRIDPVKMRDALHKVRVTGGRMQVIETAEGIKVIDDSYNANPASVKASLRALAELGGKKTVAVLGDMLELGAVAVEAHRDTGAYAARCGIGSLVAVGSMAPEIAAGAAGEGFEATPCGDHRRALETLEKMRLEHGWYVLVKGSRGMQMEKIVHALLQSRRENLTGEN